MAAPQVLGLGGVISADIAVPQHEQVLRFYSSVLTTGDAPLWREDLMNNRGNPVIGLGQRTAEYEQLPLQWMPHIQVADVAASAQRALELGGREILHGRDENGESQWAALFDPNGAAFGIMPVVPAEALPPNEGDDSSRAGRIAWLDLTVSEASATRDFYRQVVGWSVQDVAMEDSNERYADYNMLGEDADPAAGICHARGVNLGLPPVWLIYLPVGDLAESLRRVRAEGGAIIKETTGADGAPSYAVVEDPVGVALALVPG